LHKLKFRHVDSTSSRLFHCRWCLETSLRNTDLVCNNFLLEIHNLPTARNSNIVLIGPCLSLTITSLRLTLLSQLKNSFRLVYLDLSAFLSCSYFIPVLYFDLGHHSFLMFAIFRIPHSRSCAYFCCPFVYFAFFMCYLLSLSLYASHIFFGDARIFLSSVSCALGMDYFSNILTNSMEQNPSLEASSHSTSQEIPCLLWTPEVHYCVHRSTPLDPIQIQMNRVHILPPYSHNIYLYYPPIYA